MDIVVWLRSLGLGQYEAAFRENEINEKVLPSLTAEDRLRRFLPPQVADLIVASGSEKQLESH
jgi:SAM domain (Sterile alpha motif)